MRILQVHNRYQQAGGEDRVVAQEAALLRRHGHTVIEYYRTNDELDGLNLATRAWLARRLVWADDTVQALAALIEQEQPDVAHIHNTFLMISPAVYAACQRVGLPVVQTLHNYRLLCPPATFYRDGAPCEKCLPKTLAWPAVVHACYRQSRLESAAMATILMVHRWLKTWQTQIDLYLTPTHFVRQKFIEAGFPPERLLVKPHFLYPDPGPKEVAGDYGLYVGRLAPEKGLMPLLRAWQPLRHIPLKIAGDGPLRTELAQFIQSHQLSQVELLGSRPAAEVITLMKGARFLVWPSELYETFGLVAIEAFACGLPVITARLGAMAEIVSDGQTGLHFEPGQAEALRTAAEWAWRQPQELAVMGQAARSEYETHYTAERNYAMLLEMYQQAIAAKSASSS